MKCVSYRSKSLSWKGNLLEDVYNILTILYNRQTRFAGYSIHVWINTSIKFLELTFWNNHNGLWFDSKRNNSCVYKEVSGSALTVKFPYINWWKLGFQQKFSVEFWGVTTFIQGIKIYWDRFGVVNTLWEIVHLKCTCIFVSYASNIWSHNRVNPSDSHWIEVKNIC